MIEEDPVIQGEAVALERLDAEITELAAHLAAGEWLDERGDVA
jgi:hypothetical protein